MCVRTRSRWEGVGSNNGDLRRATDSHFAGLGQRGWPFVGEIDFTIAQRSAKRLFQEKQLQQVMTITQTHERQ